MTKMIDPLAAFMSGHIQGQDRWPMPLAETSFDVTIEAGLAVVETKRLFRNVEKHAIEAALTFPVPIHATFFHLEAEIEGRKLIACAKGKTEARKDYEGAIERGKATALHEELLPGIHLLSVANIKPGAEISVTSRWVMPLLFDGTFGHLRIPLTVGEVYGCSGLSDADELISGGKVQKARLTVHADTNSVMLGRGTQARALETGIGGSTDVPMDVPIDLSVPAWSPRSLQGSMKNGIRAALQLTPAASKEDALSVAILLDKSGSMAGRCSSNLSLTTHEATRTALGEIADTLRDQDVIDLWEFDTRPSLVGTAFTGGDGKTTTARLKGMARNLSEPAGGTRIDNAIIAATRHSEVRDILILTDGKSHALNVDELARLGRRISAVFIGEDSLEARLGSLVVETGGHMFIASGEDIGTQVLAALSALRGVCDQRPFFGWPADHVNFVHNNLAVDAQFEPAPADSDHVQVISPCAVAAAVTGLVLPLIPSKAADELAVQEGILTRRTSLILVDEGGDSQKGLPAFRKVRLAQPRTAVSHTTRTEQSSAVFYSMSLASIESSAPGKLAPMKSSIIDRVGRLLGRTPVSDFREILRVDIPLLIKEPGLDWAGYAAELAHRNASSLPPSIQDMAQWISEKRPIQNLAKLLAVDPYIAVLGLAALAASKSDRHAKRLIQHLLGDWENLLPPRMVGFIKDTLELSPAG